MGGLAAFNRFTRENPDLIADRMARTMAVVDVGELGRAAGGLVAPLMKAMAKNGDLLKNVVKPVVRPLVMGALALGGLVGGAVVLRRRRR